jgi:GTP-binding protein Era
MAPFKSGFISIVGRPNVGKSTLFNRLLGDKIAIVAEKPQTTRNRILGIKNVEGGQLIFLDTPGIHQGRSELNQRMVRTAIASGRDADVLLFLIEATSPLLEKDQQMIESLRGSSGIPFLVINKIDLVKRKNLLPIMDQYQRLHPFKGETTLAQQDDFRCDIPIPCFGPLGHNTQGYEEVRVRLQRLSPEEYCLFQFGWLLDDVV